jgi:hypothetical protein
MLDPSALAFAHERNPVFVGFCDYFAVRFVQLLIESVEEKEQPYPPVEA